MFSFFSSGKPVMASPGRKHNSAIAAMLHLSSGCALASPAELSFVEALALAYAAGRGQA